MEDEIIAGRSYFRVYSVSGRKRLHDAVRGAIETSGGRVLFASPHTRVPFYFGVLTDREERLGLLIYPSLFKKSRIKNRPDDENRGQLRFGSEASWEDSEHPIAFDIAAMDTTLLLGIDPDRGLFVGLDPRLWDPMPLGISYYAKDNELEAMGEAGWHAWEKDNRAGTRRDTARSESGLEAMVAFRPERFLDFARFERRATDLGLDTSLRLNTAERFQDREAAAASVTSTHVLEKEFDLGSREILEIIAGRSRLATAVRGGVAEYHLEQQFGVDLMVSKVSRRDRDAEPDFDIELASGRTFVVECKNVSPNRYADGSIKVEVQKTRASKSDPASRYYRVEEFDVVAACLFSATRKWEFRFALSSRLVHHPLYPDRIAPMQRVDASWSESLHELT